MLLFGLVCGAFSLVSKERFSPVVVQVSLPEVWDVVEAGRTLPAS